jgi:hypothetical protein
MAQVSGEVRTLDKTWSQVISGTTGYAAFFDKSHPNVAYAALGGIFGDPANGVYRSTDGGMTWTRLAGTKAHPFPAANLGRINLIEDPTHSGTLYASVSNCCAPFSAVIGIFKSADQSSKLPSAFKFRVDSHRSLNFSPTL